MMANYCRYEEKFKMIIEKFDFSTFFNTKNVTNNQKVREYGIGAVSIMTPMQAITRINEPDVTYRIPGLGSHNETETNIAKKILGIRKEKSNIPKGLSLEEFAEWLAKKYVDEDYIAKRNEQSNSIESFLNSVVKIEYTSSINFDSVIIKLPSFNLKDSKPKISQEMYEGIQEILTTLENSGLSSNSIKIIEWLHSNQNYEQIKQYLNELVDSNIIFPFEENIIIEQQSVQEKDENER